LPSLPNPATMVPVASTTPSSFSGTGPVTFATLATPEVDGAVRCVACAHRCLIRPGRSGICRVRENRHGRLVTLVYGQVVAANADPIEKKPLFHAYPGSVAFSIATRGCNFHCANCQNWAISQAARDGIAAPAFDLPPRDVVAAALASGSRSIAYTYTEPTVFIEYAVDTARLAREVGLANLLVTNGYETPEALDLFGPVIDAANVDLKAFSDDFYRAVVGARLKPVLDSIRRMWEMGVWVEVTTLLVPGRNDGEEELHQLAAFLASLSPDIPWHVSRFHPTYRMLDLPPTPLASVERALRIGRQEGLRYVYGGNVPGHSSESTVCPACGKEVISRQGFSVREVQTEGGRCRYCGEKIAGIIDPREV